MNEWRDEGRVSSDLVLMVNTRTASYEERGNLTIPLFACLHKGCASILPIDNKRYQERDAGSDNHEWMGGWRKKKEYQETQS